MQRANSVSAYDTYLLCEGKGDKDFFTRFLEFHGFKSVVVEHANNGKDDIGKTLMGKYADSKMPLENFKNIIIVIDSDDDPSESFQAVVAQLERVNLDRSTGFSVASGEFPISIPEDSWTKVLTAGSQPSVCVLSIPDRSRSGALETLCYDAIKNNGGNITDCVEAFSHCCGADAWAEQKKSKLKLRAFLSATHQRDPDIGFSRVFQVSPNLIDFNHEVFMPLKSFLTTILEAEK
jgi:hypothetical protein